MAQQAVGYQLIDANGAILDQWGGIPYQMPGFPNPLLLPNGDQVMGATAPGKFGPNNEWEVKVWSMDVPDPPPAPVLTDAEKMAALLAYAKTIGFTFPGQ